MNLPLPAQAPAPSSAAPRRNWPRRLVNAAVTLVVLAVAAATFVLSYAGVHAIALQGGVSVQLARLYPGLLDAVLVIACVAAVMLRDARWWARCWAWLVAIVVLGAIGTTDVLHAMNYALRHRLTEGVVAAAPVVAVLLAFSLLLTMLRQSRPQPSDAIQSPPDRDGRRAARQQSTASMVTTPIAAVPIDAIPVVAAGAVPRPPAPPIALPAAPAAVVTAADEPDADADQAPDAADAAAEAQEVPASVGEVGEVGEADEAVEAGEDLLDPATAPTREEPELSATAPATPDTALSPGAGSASDDPNPPTEPNEIVAQEAPSSVVAAEPPTQPTLAPRPTPQAIRYASSAAAESADDYWDSDVDPALAGQVYPVLTSDPDIDTSGYRPDKPRGIDDSDAPPFATAPFASVPRLTRMRVTPTPPSDDEELG